MVCECMSRKLSVCDSEDCCGEWVAGDQDRAKRRRWWARKKSKTLYEVAHGYVMYFTMVMSVSLLNERAKLHDRFSPVCMERGVFLYPYLVAQFTSFMSRVVGRDVISARGLEEVLRPLLEYEQNA